MPINKHGFWEGSGHDVTSGHFYDTKLAESLLNFFKTEKVTNLVDLGCGDGQYVEYFRKHAIPAQGFDGNPNTPEYTQNRCGVLDLSVPQLFEQPFDWVLSLEVGEHLPKEFEDIFINNLHNNNIKGIVLSWALEGQGGYGHFNERNNDYIKAKICALGYMNDMKNETLLRENATLSWFKNTIMVFRKQI